MIWLGLQCVFVVFTYSYSLTFPMVTRMLATVIDIQKRPEGELGTFLRQVTKSRNIGFTEAISR